ncbi:MAG: Rrf2 family transcriptional regulator [Flammeovirgaceae bacterium]
MFSQKTKYAIKALMYLARQDEREPVKTAEIAEKERIPKKFLEQILLDLKKATFVSSKQGANGGYYLLKPADQINLAEIHRLFDGMVALLPCASLKYYEPCEDCIDEKNCGLRKALIDVRDKSFAALEHKTISMLLQNEGWSV